MIPETSPKGIGIFSMIYKDVRLFINGKEIIQINKRKARRLYEAGYEVYLHPCKVAFDSFRKDPCEISKTIMDDQLTVFDKWVAHYEALVCNQDLGTRPRFYVRADLLDDFNSRQQ